MSGFVLDSSMAMSWFFEDESTQLTDAVLLRASREPAHVPALWHWETANSTWAGLRKGRFLKSQLKERLAILRELEVVTDPLVSFRVMDEVFPLAHDRGLTVYDATYLELAIRKGMPLATLDKELAKAARRMGVEVVDDGGQLPPSGLELHEAAPAYGAKKKGRRRP